jgi:hypothetical protein
LAITFGRSGSDPVLPVAHPVKTAAAGSVANNRRSAGRKVPFPNEKLDFAIVPHISRLFV